MLIEKSIEKGSVKIDLKEFKKIEGEATANNRKAKLIFLFDWQLEIKFNGRSIDHFRIDFLANVAGSDLEYKGYLEIPNLSDENEAHEIDVSEAFKSQLHCRFLYIWRHKVLMKVKYGIS